MKLHKPLFPNLLLLSLILFLTACGGASQSTAGQSWNASPAPAYTEPPAPSSTPQPTPLPTPTPFPEYDITLMMVGDNLMHMGIVRSGQQEDGSYDYRMLFEGISPQLQSADLKIINQETILGGNDLGFSGFPYFNSPTEVGDAIAAAGFNIVLHASNHAADQKLQGLENCVAFWQEQHPEVMMLGICGETASAEITASDSDPSAAWQMDKSGIGYMTVKGITFAVLNYTYGPNMEVLPSSLMGHLNLLCDYDRQSGQLDFTHLNPQVTEDIALAKENADIVIVCPHWGTEYVTSPSSYQQEFALQMTEAGADVILGTHPHVIQPVEWVQAENGNRALCFYSLGNYVSTQKDGICMLEAMAWITFHVTEDRVYIEPEQTGAIPLVCQYTSGPVRFEGVYLLQDYTEEQAAQHGIRSYGGVNLHLSDLQKWSDEILGDAVFYWED
ncbi:MAG: CapA family protein [Lachnospiraceae bacterium]|nr:CapA family protein [Lachnospiraceae bacterium]